MHIPAAGRLVPLELRVRGEFLGAFLAAKAHLHVHPLHVGATAVRVLKALPAYLTGRVGVVRPVAGLDVERHGALALERLEVTEFAIEHLEGVRHHSVDQELVLGDVLDELAPVVAAAHVAPELLAVVDRVGVNAELRGLGKFSVTVPTVPKKTV